MSDDSVVFQAKAFDRIQEFKNGMVKLILEKVRELVRERPATADGTIEVNLDDVNKAIFDALQQEIQEEVKAAGGVRQGANNQ